MMDWIEKQAMFFRNYPLIHREYKAVVHLEDKEDEMFWNAQLQHAHPALYKFIPFSKSNKGMDSTGCEQCLKYLPYLRNTFFICIDSDLRMLRGESELHPSNWVAQTYAYSWENHFCEAEHLQNRLQSKLPSATFDFRVFLSALSQVVYKPLLYLVYCSKHAETNKIWNVRKFNACMPTQLTGSEFQNNGADYLAKIKRNFDEAVQGLSLPEPADISGLDESNAYLHIQGHQLYDLVLYIGTRICSGTGIAFKSEILDTSNHVDGYLEIDKLQQDLDIILA